LAGQGPALVFAGNGLDGSPGLWRKEAGGAAAAGPAGQAATPAAKPQAQFTTLLESLVSADEAANAPAIKKDDRAVDKEDEPRVAFWMAAPTAAPQVSHRAKPADAAAETEDGAFTNDSPTGERAAGSSSSQLSASGSLTNDSLTGERAAAPETSRDAAASVVPLTPQSGTPLPVALATPMSPWPDAPEDRAELPQAAAQAVENGTPDSKRAAGAEAAAEQETTGEAAAVSQRARDVAQAGTEAKLRQTGGARPAAGHKQDAKQAAAEQETARGRSDGLQVSSTARMVPAQTQLPAGLPAAGPVLEPDTPPRRWREGRSSSPGATGKNAAANAGTVGGQPLAAPAVTGQTAAQSQPDANTEESGEEAVRAAGQTAANSAPAASELPDDATERNAARPMVVAFSARLRPVEAAPEAPGGSLAEQLGETIETAPVSAAPAAAGEMGCGEREDLDNTPAASTRPPDVSREPDRKPEVPTAAPPEPAVTARPADTPQPLAVSDTKPRESAPVSSPPAAATEPAAAPEAPKPAAAHDIKLELAGRGDQRVEVRVSERAGDMHVEVRTPDTGLAGDLRADLPGLASKLEQTGFRAETWHPAGTAERQGAAEAAPGGGAQNSERQPGQNGGQRERDAQQQPKPKAQEKDTPPQEAGKDFAWLFSSIS
jgi:hypothetical protein